MSNFESENLNYAYNWEYMHRLVDGQEEEIVKNLNEEIYEIAAKKQVEYCNSVNTLIEKTNADVLYFKVEYPGLLVGLGNPHEVVIEKKNKGQLALGFSLDYVTGMPYIPGSSLKGLMHSVLNNTDAKDYLKNIGCAAADKFVKEYLGTSKDGIGGDVFYGVYPVGRCNEKIKRLMGQETIAPHLDENGKPSQIKNPKAISFMKIMPGTIVAVLIKYKEDKFVNERKSIYNSIIKDMGIGAKTNVGFGLVSNVSAEEIVDFDEMRKENSGQDYRQKKNDFSYSVGSVYEFKVTGYKSGRDGKPFFLQLQGVFDTNVETSAPYYFASRKPLKSATDIPNGSTVKLKFEGMNNNFPKWGKA